MNLQPLLIPAGILAASSAVAAVWIVSGAGAESPSPSPTPAVTIAEHGRAPVEADAAIPRAGPPAAMPRVDSATTGVQGKPAPDEPGAGGAPALPPAAAGGRPPERSPSAEPASRSSNDGSPPGAAGSFTGGFSGASRNRESAGAGPRARVVRRADAVGTTTSAQPAPSTAPSNGDVIHLTNRDDRIIASTEPSAPGSVAAGGSGGSESLETSPAIDAEQAPPEQPTISEDDLFVTPNCPFKLPPGSTAQTAATMLQQFGCRYLSSCRRARAGQPGSCTYFFISEL